MKPENETKPERTAVVGTTVADKDTMLKVESTAWDAPKFIPKVCVSSTVEHGTQTVFLLENAEVKGVSIHVAQVYGLANAEGDSALQDTIDMWVEFGEVHADNTNTNEPPQEALSFGDASVETTDESPQEALSFDSEPTVQQEALSFSNDVDDSTPDFSNTVGIDIGELTTTNESTETAEAKKTKQKMSAREKAKKAYQLRYAESEKVKASMKSAISKAMADGKRHEDFGSWNFRTQVYETEMKHVDPITGEVTYHPILTENGEVRTRVVVNPTLADEDNPLGHVMNPRIGKNFVPIEHPDVFIPIIQTVRAINETNGCVYQMNKGDKQATLVSGEELITWDAFSFNKGARAMINLDLTGFSNKTRQESAKSLSNFGFVNLSANRISDALVEEEGGHRIGVSILNSHDGKSALQAFMTVLRTYCGNLAARGGVQALLMSGNRTKIRHMEGVVSEFDPEQFATNIGLALVESRRNLIAMNVLRAIPASMGMFDKMLTVFAKHGLVSQPSMTVEAGDIDRIPRDENGNLIVTTAMMSSDAVKVGHGHAYRAIVEGWVNPHQDYVAMGKHPETGEQLGSDLDNESIGSMNHMAQSLTGTLTKNPIVTPKGNREPLTGQKHGIEQLMNKCDTATVMLEDIAMAAVDAYANHTGAPVDDLDAMGQWLADNPDKFLVPYSSTVKGKKTLTPLSEIPEFHETWTYKIKTVTVNNKKK